MFRALRNPQAGSALRSALLRGKPAETDWPPHILIAWLYRTVEFVVLEQRRKGRRESGLSDESMEHDIPDLSRGSDDLVMDQQWNELLVECLGKLGPEYRAVLELRITEGLKYSEIAERLGENINAVATKLARGMKTLGQQMQRRLKLPRQPGKGSHRA